MEWPLAHCAYCNSVFRVPFIIEGLHDGDPTGPGEFTATCPYCGLEARVSADEQRRALSEVKREQPRERIDVRGVARVRLAELLDPEMTIDELRVAAEVLGEIRAAGRRTAAHSIDTDLPERVDVFIHHLPTARRDYGWWVMLFLTLVTIAIAYRTMQLQERAAPTPAQLERLVSEAVQKQATPLPPSTIPRPPRRNDACPCGSGHKFKYCCE